MGRFSARLQTAGVHRDGTVHNTPEETCLFPFRETFQTNWSGKKTPFWQQYLLMCFLNPQTAYTSYTTPSAAKILLTRVFFSVKAHQIISFTFFHGNYVSSDLHCEKATRSWGNLAL